MGKKSSKSATSFVEDIPSSFQGYENLVELLNNCAVSEKYFTVLPWLMRDLIENMLFDVLDAALASNQKNLYFDSSRGRRRDLSDLITVLSAVKTNGEDGHFSGLSDKLIEKLNIIKHDGNDCVHYKGPTVTKSDIPALRENLSLVIQGLSTVAPGTITNRITLPIVIIGKLVNTIVNDPNSIRSTKDQIAKLLMTAKGSSKRNSSIKTDHDAFITKIKSAEPWFAGSTTPAILPVKPLEFKDELYQILPDNGTTDRAGYRGTYRLSQIEVDRTGRFQFAFPIWIINRKKQPNPNDIMNMGIGSLLREILILLKIIVNFYKKFEISAPFDLICGGLNLENVCALPAGSEIFIDTISSSKLHPINQNRMDFDIITISDLDAQPRTLLSMLEPISEDFCLGSGWPDGKGHIDRIPANIIQSILE